MLRCVLLLDETLVVRGVSRFVETSGQTEVGELDMAIFVYKNIVGLDISAWSCENQALLDFGAHTYE